MAAVVAAEFILRQPGPAAGDVPIVDLVDPILSMRAFVWAESRIISQHGNRRARIAVIPI